MGMNGPRADVLRIELFDFNRATIVQQFVERFLL
jgi:hypothetical protein